MKQACQCIEEALAGAALAALALGAPLFVFSLERAS